MRCSWCGEPAEHPLVLFGEPVGAVCDAHLAEGHREASRLSAFMLRRKRGQEVRGPGVHRTHGRRSTYAWELAQGLTPCEACRAAELAYKKVYRERQRA